MLSESGQVSPPSADIAFLSRYGIAPAVLARATTLAVRSGSEPLDELLRHGLCDEACLYRALAAELGVAFLERPALDAGAARFPENVTSGIALLTAEGGPRFVVAPGPALTRSLLSRPRGRSRLLAVTTPSALRKAVMHARSADIADAAANALPARAPWWSCRGGPNAAQILGLVLTVAVTSLTARAAPVAVASLVIAAVDTVFLAMICLRLGALLVDAPTTTDPRIASPEDRHCPVYTIVVALYREEAVVDRIVAALARLDYPAAKLDIKFVLEAEDRATRRALEAIPLPARFEIVVAPPGRPRTKPRALNVALPLARGEHLVVFDAEDVPDRDQLRHAAAMFARLSPRVACLQGRLVIDNTRDGWLARFFTLEYAALFDVLCPALAAWQMPIPLGGTSTHFRTAALRRMLGWDAWNVTEDADLGLRLGLNGYIVGDLPSCTNEEAPTRLGAWLRQRTRWMKGYLQVCITHSRHPVATFRAAGGWNCFGALTVTLGTVVAALGYPIFMAGAVWAFLNEEWLTGETLHGNALPALGLTLFPLGFAAMVLPAAVGALRRGWPGLALLSPLMPLYFLLVSLAAWRALFELFVSPSHWHKTEHGLAKTSRSGALTGGERARPRRRRAGGPG